MNEISIAIGIVLAIVISAAIVIRQKVYGPEGSATKARLKEVRDLEIKVRMTRGLDVINEFNDLARAYIALGRLNDAEGCMRKALSIAENELGQKDPTLIPLLENYASVLEKMNRSVEAEAMHKRADSLK